MRRVEIEKPGSVVVTDKKRLTVGWHKSEFARMTDEFKRARSRFKEKFNRCFTCSRPFQIGTDDTGEVMNLVYFKGLGNKLLCTDCYQELTSDLSLDDNVD